MNGHHFDHESGCCVKCKEGYAACVSKVCRERAVGGDGNHGPLTFARLQGEVSAWSRHNFPDRDPNNAFHGMVEELGELAHARLKAKQGIRGTAEEHRAAEKDAVGDLVIYLADYCGEAGISLQEVVEQTWDTVSRRDWTKNKADGEAVA